MSQPMDGPTDSVEDPPPLQPYRPPAQMDRRHTEVDAPNTESDSDLRERARERIEERNAFRIHLVTYLAIMAMLTGIWLATSGFGSFFWPIFPMLGWGVGVTIHGASFVFEREPSEDEIAREAARLRSRRGTRKPLED